MIIHKTIDDENEIIPDGHSIKVSMMTMDAVQRQVANQPAIDERVQHNIDANRATLKAMQRDSDRAAAWSDHFEGQKAQADHSPYGKHCQQISEAWQQVAA